MIFAILLALSCGSERTPVKDLVDGVHFSSPSKLTTVEHLVSLPRPTWHNNAPRTVAESEIVGIIATVLRWHKEADQDLHVVVAGSSGQTMIVELPGPSCLAKSPYAKDMSTARDTFMKLFRPGIKLRFDGPLFFDHPHGQDGRAPNDVEIHGCLKVSLVQKE